MKWILYVVIFIFAQAALFILEIIGGMFGELVPLFRTFLFFGVGMTYSEESGHTSYIKRILIFVLSYSIIYVSPYLFEYCYFPLQIRNHVKKTEQRIISYKDASMLLNDHFKSRTGSIGFIGFFKYKMAQPISTEAVGEYIANQVENIEDSAGLITAIINIVLNIVPLVIYKFFTTILHLKISGGWITFIYWYIFYILIILVFLRLTKTKKELCC